VNVRRVPEGPVVARAPELSSDEMLVVRPSDSLSDDSTLRIGIRPANGACTLGVRADIVH